ncbi:MAG: alkaline phosphatase family protein [Nitrospira sp.]|nr:alkaline phosphatase family protein [Nitrospira sp.]
MDEKACVPLWIKWQEKRASTPRRVAARKLGSLFTLPPLFGICTAGHTRRRFERWSAACFLTMSLAGLLQACGTVATSRLPAPSGSVNAHRIDHVVIVAIDGLMQSTLLSYLQDRPGTKRGGLHDLLGVRRESDGIVLTKGTAVQQAVTVFPSFTYPSWTSMFTGVYPGAHGITGNNLFFRDRQIARYYTEYHLDAIRAQVDKDFFSDDINPDIHTLHEYVRDAGGRSIVVHNMLTRGSEAIKPDFDTLWNYQSNQSHAVDENSLWEAVHTLTSLNHKAGSQQPTLPSVFTLYFSGLDHMEHIGQDDPEEARLAYLEQIDNLLAQFFGGHQAITRNHFEKPTAKPVQADAIAWPGLLQSPAWQHTAILLVSDHGHTPVRWVDALGIEDLNLIFEELSETSGRPFRLEEPSLVTHSGLSKIRAMWGFIEEGSVSSRANIVPTLNGGALGLHIKPYEGSWSQRPDYTADVKPVLESLLLTMHKSQYDPEVVLYYTDQRYVILPYTFSNGGIQLLPSLEVDKSLLNSPKFPDAALRLKGLASGRPGDPASAPDVILLADRSRKLTYANKREWRVLEGLKIENHRHFRSDHGHLHADESVVPMIFAFGGDPGAHPHSTICHASIVDVAPTVLDLLDLLPSYEQALTARPADLRGHSLKRLIERSASEADPAESLCTPHLNK